MMGARRIDPDALIAYRYQMWTEGLFRAGPASAIGAFSIEGLAVGPQMRQVMQVGVSDYFRPWIDVRTQLFFALVLGRNR
jgi:hypothetical protein